ncbi:MAG: FkbM family methyltransferase [Scytolyngbya sp. HA4215-MV1]|jgi:hypothetical protein|nr:FkbM family methyltransferase [Scytolyngbya sp. HA4215-MV1]
MDLIEEVLERNEFIEQPPVLLDIGASKAINHKWKKIARYSICIAFDADDREFAYITNKNSSYKQLFVYNSIVSEKACEELNFYLTKSPYCSSLLEPDKSSLINWAFSDLFEVKEEIKIQTTDLKTVLQNLKIQKIDWFKTDSQGTDLRLFKSLTQQLINQVLIAEFEPGIIDAYQGEDKLYDLMKYMQEQPFWMSEIIIQGSQRINQSVLTKYFNEFEIKCINLFIKKSPGWGEVTYFNTLKHNDYSQRDYLLTWVFTVIEKQYGFSLELLDRAIQKFDDPIFINLRNFTLNKIKMSYYKAPLFFLKRILAKFETMMNG